MRILVLAPEYVRTGGGITTFYRSLLAALGKNGFEVRVLQGCAFVAEKDAARHELDGVTVETLEVDRLEKWTERFPQLAGAPELRKHIAAAWAMWEQAGFGAEADIVEACDWGFLFVPAVVEATRPVVVQCHGSLGQTAVHDPMLGDETQNVMLRLLERAMLSCTRTVQTYSAANAEFWGTELNKPVSLVRPAWSAPHLENEGAVSERALVIGRLQRWKGPHILCEALARLGDKAPVVEWIGRNTPWGEKGETSAAFLARTYPVVFGTRLVSFPPVSPSVVASRQAQAAFNIVPSEWDVFNFTAVEAMSSGRPTIVSTGAGASELIEDGVNGFLFPADDAAALADAISRVTRLTPSEALTIGRNAAETVRRELDPERIAAQRIAAYRAAITEFAANPPAPVGGWLGDICRPSQATSDQTAFLEKYPLRMLASHVASRAARKILRR